MFKNSILKIIGALALFTVSITVNAASVDFDVYAKANSTSGSGTGLNTGLIYSVGDSITGSVDVNDLWNAGSLPRWSNADGLVANLFATGTDDSGQIAGTQIGRDFGAWTQHGETFAYGSLVGEINNIFFLLGTNFNVTAMQAGVLSLYYWDSNSSDNTGLVTVSIDTGMSAVPVPAAVWLFGSGLIGFFGARKTRRLA